MGEAESLVSQSDLAQRWGVSSRTVNRRLVFLGIRPQRRGRHHYLNPEQVALAERLHHHLSQGRDRDSFNRQAVAAPEVEVVPAGQPSQEITPQQLTTLATALLAQRPPSPETDPLQRSRRLGAAAAEGLMLTSKELSAVLGHGVSRWRNGREDYGFRFKRYKQQGKVLWSVEHSFLLPG